MSNEPTPPDSGHEESKDWWENGDKVAAMLTTALMIGISFFLIVMLIAFSLKIAVWILT